VFTVTTPKKPTVPGLHIPEEILPAKVGDTLAPGWTLKGKDYVAFDYPEPFATKKEALAWMQANVAEHVVGLGTLTIEEVNNTLSPLRVLVTQAPLKDKLGYIEFSATLADNTNGLFNPGPGSGVSRIQLDKKLPANQRFKNYEDSIVSTERMLKSTEDHKAQWLEAQGAVDSLTESDKKFLEELNKVIDYYHSRINAFTIKGLSRKYHPSIWSVSSEVADNQLAGTLIHEYGHAWHFENGPEVNPYFQLRTPENNTPMRQWLFNRRKWREEFADYRVTQYSIQDDWWCEMFAENFAMYMHGEVKHMHPDMIKFFDSKFPALDFGHKLRGEIYA
jgi:hypothetical protein